MHAKAKKKGIRFSGHFLQKQMRQAGFFFFFFISPQNKWGNFFFFYEVFSFFLYVLTSVEDIRRGLVYKCKGGLVE